MNIPPLHYGLSSHHPLPTVGHRQVSSTVSLYCFYVRDEFTGKGSQPRAQCLAQSKRSVNVSHLWRQQALQVAIS
jgi:hypothetical protein